MSDGVNDTTELVIELPTQPSPVAPAPKLDARTLRRARLFGRWGQRQFPAWMFEEVEPELRAGWVLAGEKSRWQDVREAVRLGFENPEPH